MALTTAATIVGLGASALQVGQGISDANKAQKAIDNFEKQDLTNPFENIQVNTQKADQQTRAANANFATSIDALQRAGSRTIIGGIPRITESNILLQNIISQDLANQERENDLLIARGEERIQNIQENRENQALQGFGNQLNVAKQNISTGITDFVSSGLSLAGSGQNNSTQTIDNNTVSTNAVNPFTTNFDLNFDDTLLV